MNIAVLTIFPEMLQPFLTHGIVKKAIERQLVSANCINIRDFAEGKHKVTDDRPYGGGCGMVMKPEPLAKAIRCAKAKIPNAHTVYLSPQGRVFNRRDAHVLAASKGLILICGRYEGIDERICNDHIDEEISIGDYVLSGGELAAMVIMDAVIRLIPGALGGIDSAAKDSFEGGLIEHAHYTRPNIFENEAVPEVLLSGNHQAIEKWRMESSLIRTFLKRPDLLAGRFLTQPEINILRKWCVDIKKIIDGKYLPGTDTLSGRK